MQMQKYTGRKSVLMRKTRGVRRVSWTDNKRSQAGEPFHSIADSFASHLLTYGGEYYRQEHIRVARRRASRKQKSILALAATRWDHLTRSADYPAWRNPLDSYRGSSDGYKDVDADKWSFVRGWLSTRPTGWCYLAHMLGIPRPDDGRNV